jgi:hypothetical protein
MAESALTTALRLLQEARALMPSKDGRLTEPVEKTDLAVERFSQGDFQAR